RARGGRARGGYELRRGDGGDRRLGVFSLAVGDERKGPRLSRVMAGGAGTEHHRRNVASESDRPRFLRFGLRRSGQSRRSGDEQGDEGRAQHPQEKERASFGGPFHSRSEM